MGCLPAGKAGIEPQDQPGNCPECGMKLLPTDQFGFEMDKFGYKINKNRHKFVHYPHKSVAEDFLKKFWLSLILTLIVIFVSYTHTRA
jgi:hypothetical protein